MRLLLTLCIIALNSIACSDSTAIVEMQITLPSVLASETVYVSTQARHAAQNPFDQPWEPMSELPLLQLSSINAVDHISLTSEKFDDDVHIRIRFCPGLDCQPTNPSTPIAELQFVLERPFYEGKRTYWYIDIPAIPSDTAADPTQVGKCEIIGCDPTPEGNNCDDEGNHVCE